MFYRIIVWCTYYFLTLCSWKHSVPIWHFSNRCKLGKKNNQEHNYLYKYYRCIVEKYAKIIDCILTPIIWLVNSTFCRMKHDIACCTLSQLGVRRRICFRIILSATGLKIQDNQPYWRYWKRTMFVQIDSQCFQKMIDWFKFILH